MTEGKQEIWMSTLADRKNTENLVNLIFTLGKFWQFLKIWNFLKFFLLKWQQGDGAFLC